MGAAIGLIIIAVIVVILWNVYVGLYDAPPLVVRDGPFGLDAWVPVAVLITAIVILAALPIIIERLRPTGRTFHDQKRANQRNAAFLVLGVLCGLGLTLDVLVTVVTLRTSAGLVAAGLGVLLGIAAAWVALQRGDRLVIAMAGAKPVTHEQEPVFANVVAELASAASIPPPRLFVIEEPAPNAFVTGPDPARSSLIVTRGLLDAMTREELQGVIAHEISHIRNLDGRYGLLVTVLLGSALLIVDGAFSIVTFPFKAVGQLIGAGGNAAGDGAVHLDGSGGSFAFPKVDLGGDADGGDGDGAGGLVAIVLFVLVVVFTVWLLKVTVPLLSRLARAAVGREREFLADASAVELGRNPGSLESALMKVAASRGTLPSVNRATAALCFVNPLRSFEKRGRALFATHPPTLDRVNRLRELRAQPPLESIPGDVTDAG